MATRRDFLGGFTALAGTTLLMPRWVAAAQACRTTASDDIGPFFEPGAPLRTDLAPRDEPGDPIHVRVRFVGADCRSPLPGAYFGVWHADAKGEYHDKTEGYRLRGRMRANDSGELSFTTIVPGRYGGTSMRPAHFHVIVYHPTHQMLITQLYLAGDPYLGEKDGCQSFCDSKDPARHLTLERPTGGNRYETEALIVMTPRHA